MPDTGHQTGSTDPIPSAPLGAGEFPVEMLVLTRSADGWHVAAVYYRDSGGPVCLHPTWSDAWSDDDLEGDWSYLSNRVLEEGGGNWYSYEIEGYEVPTLDDVSRLADLRQNQMADHPGGPYAMNPADVTAVPAHPMKQETPHDPGMEEVPPLIVTRTPVPPRPDRVLRCSGSDAAGRRHHRLSPESESSPDSKGARRLTLRSVCPCVEPCRRRITIEMCGRRFLHRSSTTEPVRRLRLSRQ